MTGFQFPAAGDVCQSILKSPSSNRKADPIDDTEAQNAQSCPPTLLSTPTDSRKSSCAFSKESPRRGSGRRSLESGGKNRKVSASVPPPRKPNLPDVFPIPRSARNVGSLDSLPSTARSTSQRHSSNTNMYKPLNPLLASLEGRSPPSANLNSFSRAEPLPSTSNEASTLDDILNKYKHATEISSGENNNPGYTNSVSRSSFAPAGSLASTNRTSSVTRTVVQDKRDASPQGPMHFRNDFNDYVGKQKKVDLIKESLPQVLIPDAKSRTASSKDNSLRNRNEISFSKASVRSQTEVADKKSSSQAPKKMNPIKGKKAQSRDPQVNLSNDGAALAVSTHACRAPSNGRKKRTKTILNTFTPQS
ncbi:hypothetical protein AGDE_15822 [Angomonas deanei]|uniref:Uncharacterized protein n=1 Tax=Angomonas deanei TaxID=59799 RepID=A0A7G2C4M3_9TRYP|nr:hypothetical protein AGDE_15822 [Angomonas deanei]CAD2213697.1 hypothetical protein, conserved [Angomonas deanei]|eukprot:EPY18307.1 hypothetical protein AGDE_15822 [Angomonas deanei]